MSADKPQSQAAERSRRRARRRIRLCRALLQLPLCALLVLAALMLRQDSTALLLDGAAGTTYYPQKWNGKRVYLSPAFHQPENVGCSGYQESAGARNIAAAARESLLRLGYAVRVGNGDFMANTRDSRAFRSHIHVVIHSNAVGQESQWDCEGLHPKSGGTWLMYAKPADLPLARALFEVLRDASPGTNDRLDLDQNLSRFGLWELRMSHCPAAYIETAFHTYGPDVAWLRQPEKVGALIAQGIDRYFQS